MDLTAITPGNVEQSVDATLRWLTKQHGGNWLLLFDNADDVQLKLKKFFPPCASGNILVTTRNRELRHYAAKGSDENVAGMDHEDAKDLLLHLSQAEETDENKKLAAQIVQVFLSFIFIYKFCQTRARHRNSISLPWQSPKLARTFTATHH
jgi:hypothetical protein